jgi:hypothetical protein
VAALAAPGAAAATRAARPAHKTCRPIVVGTPFPFRAVGVLSFFCRVSR